jgi:hypothetical protein
VARTHYACGRSCDRPNQSRFSVGFFGSRANDRPLPKFHVFAARFSCSAPSSNFKISAQTKPTSDQTFVKLQPFKLKIRNSVYMFCLCFAVYSKCPLPATLPFSLHIFRGSHDAQKSSDQCTTNTVTKIPSLQTIYLNMAQSL